MIRSLGRTLFCSLPPPDFIFVAFQPKGSNFVSRVPFCHLHFHTCYSLLDSAVKVKDAVAAAKDMGMEHLAMTDHGVLYGAVEFYKACLSHGIKPIIGCEVYVARHGIEERSSQRNNMSLVLLAETPRHADVMASVVAASGATGNLVHDAHIAALCIEHGVSELLTGDRDFARFPEVRAVNPFA